MEAQHHVSIEEALEEIWDGDLLGRRQEADLIQKFIENESEVFSCGNRGASLVLALDAAYGEGKSWFLDRLANQLALKHPVARIDAWADDASEEPLTAFMASIEDALSPYLTHSKKLGDKFAKAKVAALPVMGRLVKGVMVKGLSKVAGDGAEDALGSTFEEAIWKARDSEKGDDGAVSLAVQGAIEEVGKEIDSLVDRRGAAMLAEYRQRKKSRAGFRSNMIDLVEAIDGSEVPGTKPLVVIIDELDRCRPNYALKVLEEIKHFFDVPGVVFIVAMHVDQLTASVEAVYGGKFNSKSYLLRFFTRTYRLRRLSVREVVHKYFSEWESPPQFLVLAVMRSGKRIEPSLQDYIADLLDEFDVTPREAYPILDSLRLFAIDTDANETIQLHALVPLLVKLARGMSQQQQLHGANRLKLASIEMKSSSHRVEAGVSLANLLERERIYSPQIDQARFQSFGGNAADNLAIEIAMGEFNRRLRQNADNVPSVTFSYPDRVRGISRMSIDSEPLERADR